jgi:hypothetical protein
MLLDAHLASAACQHSYSYSCMQHLLSFSLKLLLGAMLAVILLHQHRTVQMLREDSCSAQLNGVVVAAAHQSSW